MNGKRISKALVALLLFCSIFGFTSPVWGQSITQGAVGGIVVDASNAAVAAAVIQIHNDGTGADLQLKADATGYFKAPLLEPGTYTITISAAGYGKYVANGVTIQVGQLTELSPRLSIGGTATSVEVSAQAPVLNFDSPDFSAMLTPKAIDNLPLNNRRWSTLALLTPGVVSDSNGFGLVSVRGISPLLNNVEIDGADDNQAFFSEERGRTRAGYSTAQTAVLEFQVNAGVYSAEYGRAAGGVINSVTKSGGSKFHGQAYFYDRDNDWGSFNPLTTNTTAAFNSSSNNYTFNTFRYKPKDWRKIWGFSAGGPLVKDKLFWFYTYDQFRRNFPGTAKVNTPSSFFAQPDSTLPTGVTCNVSTGYLSGSTSTNSNYALDAQTCTFAARLKLASYAAGVSAYSTGLANLLTNLGSVPRTGDQVINTPKLDWQINDKNRASFLFHRLRWDSPGGVQTQATNNYAVDTFGTDYVKLDYGVAKLTSMINSNISNELRYQYGRELNNEGQQPYSTYTKSYMVGSTGNVPEVAIDGTGAGLYMGSPYYSYRTSYPDERKWQIADTASWTHSRHSVKFGLDIVHNHDLQNNLYEGNGYYSYSYFANYLVDALTKSSTPACNSSASQYATSTSSGVGAYPCYGSYYQGWGTPIFELSTVDYGFFAQDNWKVTPRLTLNLGLRWDFQSFPSPYSALTQATGSYTPISSSSITTVPDVSLNNHPSDKNNFGPRIGFSYSPFASGKTVVRGGYGTYFGRTVNNIILSTYYTTGHPLGQYTITYKPSGYVAAGTASPKFSELATTNGATSSAEFFAKNFQNPQIHEIDLQVQQDLGKGNIFQVTYLGSLGRELPNFLNVNLSPATTNVTITIADTTGKGPLANGATYVVPTFTGYANKSYQSVTEVVSDVNSSYHAMAVELQNRSHKSFQYDLNYVWSHAMDFAQNSSTSPSTNGWLNPYSNARVNYANSNFNIPQRFVGYVIYNLPTVETKAWWSRLTNDWSLNPSVQLQNGLPYSANIGSGYNSAAALNSGWNGAGSVTFIPVIGRNTYRRPNTAVVDFRAQKDLGFGPENRYHLQLVGEAFNLFNHMNVTSISDSAYKLSYATGQVNASTATYQSTFGSTTAANSNYAYSTRQLQLSLRLNF